MEVPVYYIAILFIFIGRKWIGIIQQTLSWNHILCESNTVKLTDYRIFKLCVKYIESDWFVSVLFKYIFKAMLNSKRVKVHCFIFVNEQWNPISSFTLFIAEIYFIWSIFCFRYVISWTNSIKPGLLIKYLLISILLKWGSRTKMFDS